MQKIFPLTNDFLENINKIKCPFSEKQLMYLYTCLAVIIGGDVVQEGRKED